MPNSSVGSYFLFSIAITVCQLTPRISAKSSCLSFFVFRSFLILFFIGISSVCQPLCFYPFCSPAYHTCNDEDKPDPWDFSIPADPESMNFKMQASCRRKSLPFYHTAIRRAKGAGSAYSIYFRKSIGAVSICSVSSRNALIALPSFPVFFRSSTRLYQRGVRHRYSGSAVFFSSSENG